MKKILLVGAYGYTGKLISKMLRDREIIFTPLGRDSQKMDEFLKEFEFLNGGIVLDLENEADLIETLKRFDIIVNCVGPFSLFSKNLLRLCVELSKRYFDISGELFFVKTSYEMYSDKAKETGACIVSSCSFESFLADHLANLICESNKEYIDIFSVYKISNTLASPGTRLTMQVSNEFDTHIYSDSQYVPCKALERQKNVGMRGIGSVNIYFVPYPEIFFFQRRYKVANCGSYFVLGDTEFKLLKISMASPRKKLSELLPRHKNSNYKGPDENARAQQQFTVGVVANLNDGSTRQVLVEGFDMYKITASIIANALIDEISRNNLHQGFFTPGEYFDREFFLRIIAENNLKLIE